MISGIQAISVVENPAIEEDFIALKEHKEELAEVDAEKRILMGPALIPNKKYLEKVIMKIAIILFTFLKIQLKSIRLFFIKTNIKTLHLNILLI